MPLPVLDPEKGVEVGIFAKQQAIAELDVDGDLLAGAEDWGKQMDSAEATLNAHHNSIDRIYEK